MRTTIHLDDQLIEEARIVAAATNRTLTQVIEDALRETFRRPKEQPDQSPLVLHTFKGGSGLQPGVDLDNSAALLELMECDDSAP